MIEIKTLASGSKGNCYLIDDGKTPLLLECGISIKEIRRGTGFRLGEVQGCLISHEHQDHCKSIKDIVKAGIDVYASRDTFMMLDIDSLLNINNHRIHDIKLRELNSKHKVYKSFRIGTWAIQPFETQHDSLEPLGYLLANQAGGKLLFATDTYYLKYQFKGLTHIMLECNYALDILNENIRTGRVPASQKKRLLKSHFSLENAKEFLRSNDLSRVEEIHLLHLSERNSDAEQFKREIQELTGKMVLVADQ